jgi:Uma2 family endonuclease
MVPPELELEPQRGLTRAQYDRMVELGMFDEDDRIELLRGRLIDMSPQSSEHAYVIQQLTELLSEALRRRAKVRVQLPFVASDDSEPEPDLVLAPPETTTHPSTAWLIVEVASESLRRDRNVKAPLYAACNVTEYWIVILDDMSVERYAEPQGGRYTRMTTHRRGERLTLVQFSDIALNLDDFLPPR